MVSRVHQLLLKVGDRIFWGGVKGWIGGSGWNLAPERISGPFLDPFLVDFFWPLFFESPGTPHLGASWPAPQILKRGLGCTHMALPSETPPGCGASSVLRVGTPPWEFEKGGGCVMRDGRVPLARPGGASIYGELFEDETYDGRAGSRLDPHPPASLGHAGNETQNHRPDAHM